MLKRILSVALAALLSTTAFAAGSNSVIDTVAVTSTASSTTLSATAEGAPRAVTIRNDGQVTVYVDFGRVAVADSTTALPVAACESLTVTFNSGKPKTASSITASGSSSIRIVGAFDAAGTSPVQAKDAIDYADMPACATLLASGTSTVNGASHIRYVDSELITLDTGALVTDSSANLLRANSIIDAATCRQVTAITVSTNWGISDPTTANRFAAATAIATTTLVGHLQNFGGSAAAGPVQAAAAKLRITVTGANAGAGVVRCSVFGRTTVAPAN